MRRLVFPLFTLVALSVLNGCGGSSSPPATSTVELSGTVATGAPVAQGTKVTVKDANGATRSTTTIDANGQYKVAVGDLTPPLAICVDTVSPANPCSTGSGSNNGVLMSAVADNKGGTANVTPFTKLAMANAAGVTDPTTIFNTLATLKAITAEKISQGLTAVTTLVGDYLKAAGIDPKTFSPLTTVFKPDGTGADSVLDVVKPKLSADGTVNMSFKGYTSNKPSFNITQPFAQYSSTIKAGMKVAWSNVAAQISPSSGKTAIIPDNVTLPPGFQIPVGAAIPAGVNIPPGVTIPASVTFASTVKIDPSVTIPSGVTVPTGAQTSVQIPLNAIIPKGISVTFPAGVTIPAGVTLPEGFVVTAGVNLASGIKLPSSVDLSNITTSLPSGIAVPATATVPVSWQTTLPSGITIPQGVTFGSSGTTTTPTTPTTPTTGSGGTTTTPTLGNGVTFSTAINNKTTLADAIATQEVVSATNTKNKWGDPLVVKLEISHQRYPASYANAAAYEMLQVSIQAFTTVLFPIGTGYCLQSGPAPLPDHPEMYTSCSSLGIKYNATTGTVTFEATPMGTGRTMSGTMHFTPY